MMTWAWKSLGALFLVYLHFIEKAKATDRRTANLPNQPNSKYLEFGRATEEI